uniref:hypothetical protein n=1 Tax=Deinococcus sp. TaxID=47478 RepID=UPI0025BCF9A0
MTISSLNVLPDSAILPLPHSAVVTVIGWITQDAQGRFFVGQVPVHDAPLKWRGKRVKATIYPPTAYPTLQILKGCRLVRARAATRHEKNQASFRIVGHLIRAEKGLQSLSIEIYPQAAGIPRFKMQVRTSRAAITECDPSWTGVEVTGSLIDQMLLAEKIAPAYAP